jgi:serine/threonine protein kinase
MREHTHGHIHEHTHPWIQVLEYGEVDLAHLMQKRKGQALDLNFIRPMWDQMLRAVQAIHHKAIIHSDLKPANFLLVGGELKLIDFGIAKAIPNDTTNIHRDHQTGTVNYMSPESIAFADNSKHNLPNYLRIGRASDVWSLGCILYQLVYGHPPFAHLSMMQKLQSIVNATCRIAFPPPPGLPVAESGDLLSILQACLVRDPKGRPTLEDLLDHPFLTRCGMGEGGGGVVLDNVICSCFGPNSCIRIRIPPSPLSQSSLSTRGWSSTFSARACPSSKTRGTTASDGAKWHPSCSSTSPPSMTGHRR